MPNIWEFLGLSANHRPKNKTVQLVKHWKEVPESKKQFPYFGQVKKDGVFAALVVADGKAAVFGRTGAQLTSCDSYLSRYECDTWPSMVYIGELVSDNHCSLEQLSGVVNPERVKPLDEHQQLIAECIRIKFHDWVPLENFIKGNTPHTYSERHCELGYWLEHTSGQKDILPYTVIHDEEARLEFAAACIASGEEGAVFKRPDLPWVAGHKGFHQMKGVSKVEYDLLCIGYEEGQGKYAGKVANLIFQWRDGQNIKAMLGKGWTHQDAFKMFCAIVMYSQGKTDGINDNFYPMGKVFRVKGLMDSSKGKIRLPKVADCRWDKTEGDY